MPDDTYAATRPGKQIPPRQFSTLPTTRVARTRTIDCLNRTRATKSPPGHRADRPPTTRRRPDSISVWPFRRLIFTSRHGRSYLVLSLAPRYELRIRNRLCAVSTVLGFSDLHSGVFILCILRDGKAWSNNTPRCHFEIKPSTTRTRRP
jgi:hypothetical protein